MTTSQLTRQSAAGTVALTATDTASEMKTEIRDPKNGWNMLASLIIIRAAYDYVLCMQKGWIQDGKVRPPFFGLQNLKSSGVNLAACDVYSACRFFHDPKVLENLGVGYELADKIRRQVQTGKVKMISDDDLGSFTASFLTEEPEEESAEA